MNYDVKYDIYKKRLYELDSNATPISKTNFINRFILMGRVKYSKPKSIAESQVYTFGKAQSKRLQKRLKEKGYEYDVEAIRRVDEEDWYDMWSKIHDEYESEIKNLYKQLKESGMSIKSIKSYISYYYFGSK